jgi:HEPN domain-containing protein
VETVLPYITESQRKLIQETISRIADLVQPEKIICYGIRTKSGNSWSAFLQTPESHTVLAIDLLIILDEKDKGKRESISAIAENLSGDTIKLITVVHSIDAVNANLEAGNPFFTTLQRLQLVYDSNRSSLSLPTDKAISESFQEANQRKADLAIMFYETASECASDNLNDVAAFMLHQTVELTCIALLRTCLGYKPTTHSIKKRLLLLIENITLEVSEIFPRSTNEEDELFDILQRAYSDVRYKYDYTVSADKVFILLDRVNEFHALALGLCRERWDEHNKTQYT